MSLKCDIFGYLISGGGGGDVSRRNIAQQAKRDENRDLEL